MAGKIYPTTVDGNTYYYFKESHRVKVNDTSVGKKKGSGKSKVKTVSIYLGTAYDILALKKGKNNTASVTHRSFGVVAAVYQTAKEFGMIDILKKHIKGKRYDIDRWKYFLITIINGVDHSCSKNKMKGWLQKTILPDLLEIDIEQFSSKKFWYVTDDVISESLLQEKRKNGEVKDKDVFCGINDKIFQNIEEELFQNISSKVELSGKALVYDTTNFFTYFEAADRSELSSHGHNKDSHHHLRQISLAMTLEKTTGLPFFHRVYRGNCHDSKLFSNIIGDLTNTITKTFKDVEELVLLLDKGNNTKENFAELNGKIDWIGSLVPSHHDDLLSLPLEEYKEVFENMKVYRTVKNVMGKDCEVLVTYNPKLARKQSHTLNRGIDKLEKQLREKIESYKQKPTKMTTGLKRILKDSRYSKFFSKVKLSKKKGLVIERKIIDLNEIKSLGKNLLFTSRKNADTNWIIKNYKEKDVVEQGFKTIKDPDLIRIRPLRHWTDTKIRAYIFCCIMSYVLLKLMNYKMNKAGLQMSLNLLKEELSDLQEIVMIFKDGSAERKISDRSSVQQKIFENFKLGEVEKRTILTQ